MKGLQIRKQLNYLWIGMYKMWRENNQFKSLIPQISTCTIIKSTILNKI